MRVSVTSTTMPHATMRADIQGGHRDGIRDRMTVTGLRQGQTGAASKLKVTLDRREKVGYVHPRWTRR